MEGADLELMVAATEENIMMVEGEMKEDSEDVMLESIKFAHEEMEKHCRIQKELNKELGKGCQERLSSRRGGRESREEDPRFRLRQVLRSRQVREA